MIEKAKGVTLDDVVRFLGFICLPVNVASASNGTDASLNGRNGQQFCREVGTILNVYADEGGFTNYVSFTLESRTGCSRNFQLSFTGGVGPKESRQAVVHFLTQAKGPVNVVYRKRPGAYASGSVVHLLGDSSQVFAISSNAGLSDVTKHVPRELRQYL